jgi:hypothetical protein
MLLDILIIVCFIAISALVTFLWVRHHNETIKPAHVIWADDGLSYTLDPEYY